MKQTLVWGLSAAITALAASANADPLHLKGSYGFTGTGSCLFSSMGFNSTLQANGGTVFSSLEDVEGIRTFKSDGTGTVKASGVNITFAVPPASFQPSAGSETWTFSFTYTVNSDDSWTTDLVPGSFSGKVLTGPRVGQTFTIANFPTFTGLISKGEKTLTAAYITPQPPLVERVPPPAVETVTYSNGDVLQRICTRSRVLIDLRTDQ
jgi:hypothetical protein